MSQPFRVVLVHPGVGTSTADVESGLYRGLTHHGVDVHRYRLDRAIAPAQQWLSLQWKRAVEEGIDVSAPTREDVFYQAGLGVLEMALRVRADLVFIVSAMLIHPDLIELLRRAKVRVALLFTESPYDLSRELPMAALADQCWTNERTCVPLFQQVQPQTSYLPHAWHPETHRPGPRPGDEAVAAHDVVFVGTGFKERVDWLTAIDWTGIDLGLYGNWDMLPAGHSLCAHVKGQQIENEAASALYRRATVGLNLYRSTPSGLPDAESLNPRAYELAACGRPYVSMTRAEGDELFQHGEVPMCRTPVEATSAIRSLLRDASRRTAMTEALPRAVRGASWVARAGQVLTDLHVQ